ncbi:hypothetical protein DSO57_1002282 [Entomophthora muscae]|uniref:Uncharacterized protein n=1 Tax=Entomophthora muscae TaxID=34485 RepID=A0ACC2TKS7_9FUNG|nr:hypothetical protein DSO57_1002282 [Entomophthora muscae]
MGTSSRKALEHLKFSKNRTALTEVEEEDGDIKTTPHEIKEEVRKFYKKLYTFMVTDQ